MGWDSQPPSSNLREHIGENDTDGFQQLDRITPEPDLDQRFPGSEIAESITVRTRSPVAETLSTGNIEPQGTTIGTMQKGAEGDLRRSGRNRKPAELFTPRANYALFAGRGVPEPETLTDALNSDERDKWRIAWESELASLSKNDTWVVEPLPQGRTAIGCRWVFKRKDDGCYKARLVAKGYSQILGIDYAETFAPVAKFTTIRLLLALSCENDWEIIGMDVKTAFLNSELEEQVYMEIPEGVSIPAQSNQPQYRPRSVCRLLKSIYGLKQSPRAWYGRIHDFFTSNNFIRSESDHSLFINYEKKIILLLYVDDLVLAAPSKDLINWIRMKLHKEFEMTDLGDLSTFLGLEIERNRSQRTLHLSQRTYIIKILTEYGMLASNPTPTPADVNVQLQKSNTEFVASLVETQAYQSAVGSLMYVMLGTRPDISYAVSKVSQYSTNPNHTHWTAVKRIFRYLAGTPNRGLYYGIQGNGTGYTDADWGSGEDRRSIGGYAFILNGAAISWNSKKQATVALSSTEAEYVALTQAVKESLWLQGILDDLGARKHLTEMSNISIDNQGAIALAKNPEFHARTKHIDIQYHFVSKHIEKGDIGLTYCHTSKMTADIFTKALPQPTFTTHNLALGLIDLSVPMLQRVDSCDIENPGKVVLTGAPARGGIVEITGALPEVGSFTVHASSRRTMR